MLPVLALPLADATGFRDEEIEIGVRMRGRKNAQYHPGALRGDGYNPLGTTKFDELVEKSKTMYPGRVWVVTLRGKTLRRVVPQKDEVVVRSTRYLVEVKVHYATFHLDWDIGNLDEIAQSAKHNRSLDTRDPSNEFKSLIYDYERILKEVSCGWRKNQSRGGYERARMSNAGLMLLANQWNREAVVEGILKELSYRGTSIRDFVKYPSVQLAIGYAIIQGVMKAFSGRLEAYVSNETLYEAMREPEG